MTDTSPARPSSGGAVVPDPVPAQRRRQLILLAILTAALGVVVVYVLLPALFGGSVGPAPAGTRSTTGAGSRATPRSEVVDVHLGRLSARAVEPIDGGRNPFRMGAATPPPGASDAGPRVPMTAPAPTGPVGPPPPPPTPPIPFRFIGIVTGSRSASKIAVLSDGRHVVHGAEGAVVDGRYRIVKIGEESIQMEHADGRGRQTIRLSGQ